MSIRRITLALILTALMTASFGCVSQRERDNFQTLYRSCQGQLIDLKHQLEEARSQIQMLQNTSATPSHDNSAMIAQLTAQRDQLVAKIRSLEASIREAALAPVQLPPEIDQALTALAKQHADLMTYDPGAGMVKLRSDLTFALGSAKISDQASRSIGDLAAVLRQVVEQGYEIRVAGHTDNVPIRRAATKVQHPTNWHLSVHRAISVKDVLQNAGIPSVRLTVAGHGEHRPVAANGPKGNAANRRVEIFITPNTYTAKFTPAPAAAAPSAPAPAAPPAADTPAVVTSPDTPDVQPEPPASNSDPAFFK